MAVSCVWSGRRQIQTCCGQQDKVCKGCYIKPQSPPGHFSGHFRLKMASGISQWCASWTQVGWNSKCNPKCLPSKMIPQDLPWRLQSVESVVAVLYDNIQRARAAVPLQHSWWAISPHCHCHLSHLLGLWCSGTTEQMSLRDCPTGA